MRMAGSPLHSAVRKSDLSVALVALKGEISLYSGLKSEREVRTRQQVQTSTGEPGHKKEEERGW